jgi:hypothetical protein
MGGGQVSRSRDLDQPGGGQESGGGLPVGGAQPGEVLQDRPGRQRGARRAASDAGAGTNPDPGVAGGPTKARSLTGAWAKPVAGQTLDVGAMAI